MKTRVGPAVLFLLLAAVLTIRFAPVLNAAPSSALRPALSLPLGEAVDNTDLPWTSDGQALWFGETDAYFYGDAAAQSGVIGDNQNSSLATSAIGPAIVSFYWKISSAFTTPGHCFYADILNFYVDGIRKDGIYGEVDWHNIRCPLPPGTHTLEWRYAKDSSYSAGRDCGWIDKVELLPRPNISLAESLDNADLIWTTETNAGWWVETDISYFGGDAAQSGLIPDGQSNLLTTTIVGPARLTFVWKVSSEPGYDGLGFYVDGSEAAWISGETNWQTKTYCLSLGRHVLEWKYTKDELVAAGDDCGWLDQIEVAPIDISLGEAVDNMNLVWETWGNNGWAGENCLSIQGGDSARSGLVAGGQESCLGTTIIGPGALTFYWAVSSHTETDYLRFYIDGLERNRISGHVFWDDESYAIPSGPHRLEWKYINDPWWSVGWDCGWLDNVQFRAYTPSPTPTPYGYKTPTPIPTPSSTVTPTPPYLILQSGDYDGDGASDIAVFRPTNGLWAAKDIGAAFFGASGDIPASGDYDGDRTTEAAIFRPSNGLWAMRGVTRLRLGESGDIPVPADYDGDGRADAAVFRPNEGLWSGQLSSSGWERFYLGTAGDLPVPADYDGDGGGEPAIFRPISGLWSINKLTRFFFGTRGDIPLPRDFDGDGTNEIALFRPSSGSWLFRGITSLYFGSNGDIPVPADYDGSGRIRPAIFRLSSGFWAIRNLTRCWFGRPGDLPVAE